MSLSSQLLNGSGSAARIFAEAELDLRSGLDRDLAAHVATVAVDFISICGDTGNSGGAAGMGVGFKAAFCSGRSTLAFPLSDDDEAEEEENKEEAEDEQDEEDEAEEGGRQQ